MTDSADFFRGRLDQMIDSRHPPAVLASRMPWQEIEASIAHRFARKVRSGKKIEDQDLFGPMSTVVGAGVSSAGRPRLPLRLMISLLHLKYFSGLDCFEHRCPCDPSLLVRFRRALGEEGGEELLAQTKLLKRRNAIEPVLGHLKTDHRMDRCPLKGEIGDRLHAVLCAAGYNIRRLMRLIAAKGLRALILSLPIQQRYTLWAIVSGATLTAH